MSCRVDPMKCICAILVLLQWWTSLQGPLGLGNKFPCRQNWTALMPILVVPVKMLTARPLKPPLTLSDLAYRHGSKSKSLNLDPKG